MGERPDKKSNDATALLKESSVDSKDYKALMRGFGLDSNYRIKSRPIIAGGKVHSLQSDVYERESGDLVGVIVYSPEKKEGTRVGFDNFNMALIRMGEFGDIRYN